MRDTRLYTELDERRTEALAARTEVAALQSTKLFRYTRELRRAYGFLRRHPPRRRGNGDRPDPEIAQTIQHGGYEAWVRTFDTMDEQRRAAIAARVRQLTEMPLVSVLMPVFDPPVEFLRRALESVRNQIYPNSNVHRR